MSADQDNKNDNTNSLFPFAAVVNQEKAKEALLLAVINPAVHGVLFLGEKGTGKTTLVRSLSTLLPETQVIDLPLGCGEEMVLGTLDAEKALATGKMSVKPGILTRADKHVLYIDEVNLLADHLMDIILDAAATGQYRLEREGISSSYAARFILVGSMNPEEGWLRPQLLDRFGLAVHVSAISSVKKRTEVFKRAQAFAADPRAFVQSYQERQREITEKLQRSQKGVANVTIADSLINQTIETILQLGVRTHRAELAILQGAKARAAWYDHDAVTWEDIQTVMPLALQHRIATVDIQQPVTRDLLNERLLEINKKLSSEEKKGWFPTPFYRKKKSRNAAQLTRSKSAPSSHLAAIERSAHSAFHKNLFKHHIPMPQVRPEAIKSSGIARSRKTELSIFGRKRSNRLWLAGPVDSVATIFHAWRRRRGRPEPTDLMMPIYSSPQQRLVIFLLDVSDSMVETVELMRRWLAESMGEAYFRRDPMTIITVQGTGAKLLVQPTTSIHFVLHRLTSVTVGGATPLDQGLLIIGRMIRQWQARYPVMDLIVLSDGRSTGSLERPNVSAASVLIRKLVRQALVINPIPIADRFARNFAGLIGARLVGIQHLLES